MQQGKVLFMDLDDTLLSEDKSVSPKNFAAIQSALKRGHSIVVTTGRPVKSGRRVADGLGLNGPGCYLIAFNGAVIYDCAAERVLMEKTVTLSCAHRLLRAAKEAGIYAQTYNKEDVLAERYAKELEFYTAQTGMTYRLLPDLAESLEEEPYKVLLICLEGRERLERFREQNLFWSKERLNSFFSNSAYLEYCPLGVDKGAALLEFCSFFGISPERTVAVGDERNDISMLRAAHVGVAVSNAADEAKEAADYVTERDCNRDAVAEVIEKFLG